MELLDGGTEDHAPHRDSLRHELAQGLSAWAQRQKVGRIRLIRGEVPRIGASPAWWGGALIRRAEAGIGSHLVQTKALFMGI
jgi:hypothetical protein